METLELIGHYEYRQVDCNLDYDAQVYTLGNRVVVVLSQPVDRPWLLYQAGYWSAIIKRDAGRIDAMLEARGMERVVDKIAWIVLRNIGFEAVLPTHDNPCRFQWHWLTDKASLLPAAIKGWYEWYENSRT